MSNPTLITAATAIFVVAAMLYAQMYVGSGGGGSEGFAVRSPNGSSLQVASATEGYENPADTYKGDAVPADLNRAPVVASVAQMQGTTQRPVAVPGAITAPREALASQRELGELDTQISTWLAGAAQRERERIGALTPDQLQHRVILQGRQADVRTQLGTGLIMDSQRVVTQETLDLRHANAGWRQAAPTLEEVYLFGQGVRAERFLTADQYAQWRRLFNAGLAELQGVVQPDPLQRVRLQQLQVMREDLNIVEGAYHPPPIRMGSAKLYLQQMLRSDQPLPTLFSMEPDMATMPKHADSPLDVLAQLKDMEWSLHVRYDPAGQALKSAVGELIQRIQREPVPPQEVGRLRAQIAELQTAQAPGAYNESEGDAVGYDPSDLITRARVLQRQIHEAFPHDATALGAPKKPVETQYEAETVINTVCDRLYTSVPTVTAQQFNCPKRNV
jgi:hypothetical protein